MSSDIDKILSRRSPSRKMTFQETCLGSESSSFEEALFGTGLRIFRPLSDLGCYKWAPTGENKSLENITSANEVTRFIGLPGEPSALVDLQTLSLPIGFRQLKPDECENIFPYGQNLAASISVAKKRGFSFNTIEFCFGGNTLNFLVNQDVSDGPFFVTKIPGTKTLAVAKGKHYTTNFTEFGFQFERLVTGRAMESNGDHSTVEHIHTMKVGRHNVLFRAKVDSKSKKGLVKITASNPRYWGNTKLLQMISSGSPYMCHGVKGRGCVKKVRLLSLSDVASEAQLDCALVEHRILDGMKDIQEQMKDAKQGQVYEVTFRGTSVKLVLETAGRVSLLPSPDVVGELIR